MMNSAETAEALTHAIRPDGAAQMNSISRDLDHAIGPPEDEMSGMRMPQPRLDTGELLGDAMAGRFAVIGPGEVLEKVTLPPENIAAAISAEAHPEVAEVFSDLGITAMILRPDFYCFGSVGPQNSGGVERCSGRVQKTGAWLTGSRPLLVARKYCPALFSGRVFRILFPVSSLSVRMRPSRSNAPTCVPAAVAACNRVSGAEIPARQATGSPRRSMHVLEAASLVEILMAVSLMAITRNGAQTMPAFA